MTSRVPMNDLRRHTKAIGVSVNQALDRVIERGWYVLGPENEAFEAAFATYCGVRHAVSVANGTDAIELALRAVGIEAGHTVATVANAGFYATTAISGIGAKPVYVDVEGDTHLMSLSALRHALSNRRIDAVVVTHLYGRLANVEEIVETCKRLGTHVVEDCAQAHGAARDGKRAGSFGAVGCFSFYPTKNLGALGDGGAVTTNDSAIADRVRAYRQYGWDKKYSVASLGGCNSRLDELQAAVLNVKLPYLDEWNARRRAVARRYVTEIKNPRVECPQNIESDFTAHLFVVRCNNRENLRAHLEARGVSTDIHYPIPDYRQSAFRDLNFEALPVTERLATEVLTLPCFPEMTEGEISQVIEAVNSW